MAEILFLALFNFIFFWKMWVFPFRNATGELLSTHFPHWYRYYLKDDIYYYYPYKIPFLSCFYPVHYLAHLISKLFKIDTAFKILHYTVIGHYFLGSVLAYLMFSKWFGNVESLIGAVTLTYSAYCIKIQNPCVAYTMNWIPGMFIFGSWLAPLSLGMALLSGYYPVLIFVLPVALIYNPICAFGILIGLVQIIPFLQYLPQTIRYKQKNFSKNGVPWYRFLDLIIPNFRPFSKPAGLFWPETAMFMGVMPLFIFFKGPSLIFVCLIISILLSVGLVKVTRGASRALYLMTFSIAWAGVGGLSNLGLYYNHLWFILIAQCFLLYYFNSEVNFPMFPFNEMQMKPSRAFYRKWLSKIEHKKYRVSGLPFPMFTGYVNGLRTLGYNGGFQLRKMHTFRNDSSPNGSGKHKWDGTNEDAKRYSVKYFYERGKIIEKEADIPTDKPIEKELLCLITRL